MMLAFSTIRNTSSSDALYMEHKEATTLTPSAVLLAARLTSLVSFSKVVCKNFKPKLQKRKLQIIAMDWDPLLTKFHWVFK